MCRYSTPPTLSSPPPSGTHLTGWTSLKHWWRRTRGSWKIWETCADRCASWRSVTRCTCSAPASWRRSSAGPTLSAISWTPTRDRQAVGWEEEGEWCSCVDIQVMLNTVWPVHVFGKPCTFYRALLPMQTVAMLSLAGSWASHQALCRGHESWEVAVWV